jgi:hypothetical protein
MFRPYRCSFHPSGRHGIRIARPRDEKEIPRDDMALMLMVSMIGTLTGFSDPHWTKKLAPDPPLRSDCLITYRTVDMGPSDNGSFK